MVELQPFETIIERYQQHIEGEMMSRTFYRVRISREGQLPEKVEGFVLLGDAFDYLFKQGVANPWRIPVVDTEV